MKATRPHSSMGPGGESVANRCAPRSARHGTDAKMEAWGSDGP
jgi:hypothetical protein